MYLQSINTPADLKSLKTEDLPVLCEEIRKFLQKNTAVKEGHIRSSLGVTELTVALHYVFDTPEDVLVWDVGHQAYVHKILTGRKERFKTNRFKGGLSGFTNSRESEYDPFGAGHSSTSISAVAGFAAADLLQKKKRRRIAVIGDGALTGGMSFEALNFVGERQLDVIIILNDNSASIDENVGALAAYNRYEEFVRSLGIKYLGIVDGHNVEEVVNKLLEIKDLEGPRFLRVKTQKGKGRMQVAQAAPKSTTETYQDVFSKTLLELAESDERIVALTPAMLSGGGLAGFMGKFPHRCFDVGIAEQHVVTMAAAMAANGLRPLVHLYSTFSQRAYDQIIHDVALQKLPVVFCLDRAGVAGADGPTHHGAFDPGFLNTVPGLCIAAPGDAHSLKALLREAFNDATPWALRYPKDACAEGDPNVQLPKGKARLLKTGRSKAVLSFGAVAAEVKKAVQETDFAHYDFPYLKPIDREALREIGGAYEEIITVEENSARGGLGDTVRSVFSELGMKVETRSLALPDHFIEHGSRSELLRQCGLDAESIRRFVSAS